MNEYSLDDLPEDSGNDPELMAYLSGETGRMPSSMMAGVSDAPEALKGAISGYHQLRSLGYGVTGLLGEKTGWEGAKKWGVEGYQSAMEDASRYQASVPDITRARSAGEVADWMMYYIPNAMVSTMPTIAVGGVPGLVAKAGGKKFVEKAATELVKQGIGKTAAKEMAQAQLAKRVQHQMMGSTLATGVGMSAGGIYGDTGDADVALSHGAVAGAIDALPVMSWLKKAGLGKVAREGIADSVGKAMGKGALEEAGTEGLQSFIEQHASHWVASNGESLLQNMDAVDWREMINSSLAGAGAGGTFSGMAGIPNAMESRRMNKASDEELTGAVDGFDQRIGQVVQAKNEAIARGQDTKILNEQIDNLKLQRDKVNRILADRKEGVTIPEEPAQPATPGAEVVPAPVGTQGVSGRQPINLGAPLDITSPYNPSIAGAAQEAMQAEAAKGGDALSQAIVGSRAAGAAQESNADRIMQQQSGYQATGLQQPSMTYGDQSLENAKAQVQQQVAELNEQFERGAIDFDQYADMTADLDSMDRLLDQQAKGAVPDIPEMTQPQGLPAGAARGAYGTGLGTVPQGTTMEDTLRASTGTGLKGLMTRKRIAESEPWIPPVLQGLPEDVPTPMSAPEQQAPEPTPVTPPPKQPRPEPKFSLTGTMERVRQERRGMVRNLEAHLAESQRTAQEAQQREEDWRQAEIQKAEQDIISSLKSATPPNQAMAQALGKAKERKEVGEQIRKLQALVDEDRKQREQELAQQRQAIWEDYDKAERQRMANDLVVQARERNLFTSVMGERVAQAYADRGEIPPGLEQLVTGAKTEDIERLHATQEQLERDKALQKILNNWQSEQPEVGQIPEPTVTGEATGELTLPETKPPKKPPEEPPAGGGKPAEPPARTKPTTEKTSAVLRKMLESGLAGDQYKRIAELFNIPKTKKGEKTEGRKQRIEEIYRTYEDLLNTSADSLEQRSKSDLSAIAEKIGKLKSFHRKDHIINSIIKWRDDVSKTLSESLFKGEVKRELRKLHENSQPIPVTDAKLVSGKDGWFYTQGDLQVAEIVGDTELKPAGKRGQHEELYRLAEGVIDEKEWIVDRVRNSPDFDQLKGRVSDITNFDILDVAVDYKPLAEAIGVPEQYIQDFSFHFGRDLGMLVRDIEKPAEPTPTGTEQEASVTDFEPTHYWEDPLTGERTPVEDIGDVYGMGEHTYVDQHGEEYSGGREGLPEWTGQETEAKTTPEPAAPTKTEPIIKRSNNKTLADADVIRNTKGETWSKKHDAENVLKMRKLKDTHYVADYYGNYEIKKIPEGLIGAKWPGYIEVLRNGVYKYYLVLPDGGYDSAIADITGAKFVFYDQVQKQSQDFTAEKGTDQLSPNDRILKVPYQIEQILEPLKGYIPYTEYDYRPKAAEAAPESAKPKKPFPESKEDFKKRQERVRDIINRWEREGKKEDQKKPVSNAPEHKNVEAGKALDLPSVYPRSELPATYQEASGIDENVVPLEMTAEDFAEVTAEWDSLMEDPAGKVITAHRVKGTEYINQGEADDIIQGWMDHAYQQSVDPETRQANADKTILSFFDYSGTWSRPYEEAGYNVIRFDIQHGQDVMDFSAEYFIENWDISDVYGILAACPCTDFASSGARHFAAKDQDGRTEASKALVFQTMRTIEFFRPKFWVLENPVGRIQKLTNIPKARMTFEPHHFGDSYTKNTVLFGKFNTDLPLANVDPVEGSKIHQKYGGKSLKTKNARSKTPEGFAYSFFMANNYADAKPVDRLLQDFPDMSGAIRQAVDKGLSEPEIREIITDDYENDLYHEARNNLIKAVKDKVEGEPQTAGATEGTSKVVQHYQDQVIQNSDNAEFKTKFTDNPDNHNARLAAEKFVEDYAVKTRREDPDNYKAYLEHDLKGAVVDALMEYRAEKRASQAEPIKAGDRVQTRYSYGTVRKVGRKYAEVVEDYSQMVTKVTIDSLNRVNPADRASEYEDFKRKAEDLIRKVLEDPKNAEGEPGLVARFVKDKIFQAEDIPVKNLGQLTGLLSDAGVDPKGWLGKLVKEIKAGMEGDAGQSLTKPGTTGNIGKYQIEPFNDSEFLVSGTTFPEMNFFNKKGLGGTWDKSHKAFKYPESRRDEIIAALRERTGETEPETTKAAGQEPVPETAANAEAKPKKLTQVFYDLLSSGKTLANNHALKAVVAEREGIKSNAVTAEQVKKAQEAFEVALVMQARDIVAAGKNNRDTFYRLLEQYQTQPNLSTRSSTSMENQAYSTPAPLAYIAGKLAGLDPAKTVYEPTAGNGMLLVNADVDKATVNELDHLRASHLSEMGYQPTQHDAATWIPNIKHDVVIANPPFGVLKHENGSIKSVDVNGYSVQKLEHLIAAKALDAMADDGKATLILGAKKKAGEISERDRIFFNWLYGHYNVAEHFEVDGDLYKRQGAGWPVHIITVHGRQHSDRLSPKSGKIERLTTWDAIYERYQSTMDSVRSGHDGRREGGAVTTGTATDRPAGTGTEADRPVSGLGSRGGGRSESGGRTGSDNVNVADTTAGISGSGQSGKRSGEPANVRSGQHVTEQGKLAAGTTAIAGDSAGDQGRVRRDGPAPVTRNTGKSTVSKSDFQTTYQTASGGSNDAVLTPVNMANNLARSLQDIANDVGNIDEYVMDRLGYGSREDLYDAFMGLQIDTIAAAIYNHEKKGKGIIIADQTGVGKGRQAAGIIRYAKRKGLVPVFVTVKDNLFTDMYNDLQDIGETDIRPLILNQDAFIKQQDKDGNPLAPLFKNQSRSKHVGTMRDIVDAGKLPQDRNALFMTYSQVNTDNLQRNVLEALKGKALFVLDESHNAAGERYKKVKGGGQKATTAGFIYEQLGNSPVTYLSATYAKRPDNMPLYYRTDVMDAVDTVDELITAVNYGGVPLQTIMANMLAESGQLFRRERTFEGIEVRTEVDYDNGKQHQKAYDTITKGLRAINQADRAFQHYFMPWAADNAEALGEKLRQAGNQPTKSIDHQNFTSIVHNYIRQILMALKADKVIADAVALHKKGIKPVIATDSTMGSFIKDTVDRNGLQAGDEYSYDYRNILSRALERTRRVSIKDKKGDSHPVPIEMDQLDPITRGAFRDAQKAIDSLDIADLPVSPIDYVRQGLIDAGLNVAEITGRDYIVDYSGDSPVLATRDKAEQKDKRGTVDGFNNGNLDALILNQAGSTGLSIHASERFKDNKPRHMIVWQASQDINTLMQMLGRINRTGQVEKPSFSFLNVDLPAEKRPTAIISEKMKSLNANTSANSESDTSINAPNILNKYGSKVINDYLMENWELRMDLDLGASDTKEPDPELARKFTGRLALLPVKQQAEVYSEIEERYKEYIDYLDKTDQNELNPKVIDLDAKIVSSKILYQGKKPGSVFGGDTTLHEVDAKYQGKTPTPEEVGKALDKTLKDKTPEAIAKDILDYKEKDDYFDRQKRRLEQLRKTAKAAVDKDVAAGILSKPGQLSDVIEQLSNNDKYGPEHKLTKQYEALQKQQENLDTSIANDESIAQASKRLIGETFKVGNHVTLDIADELVTGVVTNIKDSHKAGKGNPYALSKTRVSFMINNGVRQVDLPLSQLTSEMGVFKERLRNTGKTNLEDIFTPFLGTGERREIRYIATGNVISGFAKLSESKGRVISFTDSNGKTHQGIFMPRNFKEQSAAAVTKLGDIPFRHPDILTSFLRTSDRNAVYSSRHIAQISRDSQGNWTIEVPTANSQQIARDIKFDKALQDAMGTEFYSRGGRMTAVFSDEKLQAVANRLLEITPFYTNSSNRKAYEEAGGPPVSKAKQTFDERQTTTETPAPAGVSGSEGIEIPAYLRNNEPLPILLNKKAGQPEGKKQVKMPVSAVERIVRQFKQQYPGLKNLEIGVLNDTTELSILRHPENNPDQGGVYIPGSNRIYLFAGNLRSFADVFQVLRHETFAHFAIDSLAVQERHHLIEQIHQAVTKDKNLNRIWQEVDKTYHQYTPRVKAEEVIARISEDPIAATALKKVWFQIKQILRRYFGKLPFDYWEAQGFIVDFVTRVENGTYQPQASEARDWGPLPHLRPESITSEENLKHGMDAMNKVLAEQADVKDAMYRDDIGYIDFLWGTEGKWPPTKRGIRKGGKGISHIIESRIRKDGLSEAEAKELLFALVRTVAEGEVIFRTEVENAKTGYSSENIRLAFGDYIATLVSEKVGKENHYILTGFEDFETSASGEHRQAYDRPVPTHNRITPSRPAVGAEADTNILEQQDTGNTELPAFIRRNKDKSVSFNVRGKQDQAGQFFSGQSYAENELLKTLKRVGMTARAAIRKGLLPTLGGRQITDVFSKVANPLVMDEEGNYLGNPIKNYQKHLQDMQALASNKAHDANEIDIAWGDLATKHPEDYETVADIMHRATVYEVRPESAFEPFEDLASLKEELAEMDIDDSKYGDIEDRIKKEQERKDQHRELKKLYDAMSQQARDVYKNVEKYYGDLWQETHDALIDNVMRNMDEGRERQAFLDNLKSMFMEAQVRGPYFPLKRFGQYYAVAEDSEGNYYREHFETAGQLDKGLEELERDGFTILKSGMSTDFDGQDMSGVSQFANQLHTALNKEGFDDVAQEVKNAISSEINQVLLQMLPDISASKSQIHRRKIKGYSRNARRTFAFTTIHAANRLARITYGDQMMSQIRRIEKDIDSHNMEGRIPNKDVPVLAAVVNEMKERHKTVINPNGSPLASHITNAAFIWYLGASAGAGLINMTQTPLLALPLLGGKFGYRKSGKAFLQASKDFAVHSKKQMTLRKSVMTLSDESVTGISTEEKNMLLELVKDGTIETTQTHTLAGIADTDVRPEMQKGRERWDKVMRLTGFFFHNAEVANREVTALAAYRLARANMSHTNAIEVARKTVFDSHFDYSGANRPRMMKNNWVKVFTIFKQYSQNMTYTLLKLTADSLPFRNLSPEDKKTARKALAGILFGHATMAGTLGLPLVSWIGPALAAAFGDDEDEYRDWETMYRNWLADLFGKETGHAIAKGVVNGFLGKDLNSRISLNDLWIRSPNYEMSAREESMHYTMQALGPAAAAGINVVLGLDQMIQGQTLKGFEKMVPKFIRDGIRTYRYSTEGATVGREGYQAMIEDFSAGEVFWQSMGISPARLSEAYGARSSVMNMESRIKKAKGDLLRNYYRAYRESDYDAMRRVMGEIQQFNQANPMFRIKSLAQSIRARNRYEQMSDSGIYLPYQQKGLLSEARYAM